MFKHKNMNNPQPRMSLHDVDAQNGTPLKRCDLRAIILIALLILTFILYTIYAVYHNGYEPDEGFYMNSSWNVLNGLKPYRDFGFTHTPASAWIGSIGLAVFGWDLYGARFLGMFLSTVSVAIGVVFLYRKAGIPSVVIFSLLIVASPGWMEWSASAKPFALGGLCILLGGIVVLSDISVTKRWWCFVCVAALGCLVRLPLAPFFLVGSCAILVDIKDKKQLFVSLLGSAIFGFLILYFISYDCIESAWFWIVEYHSMRHVFKGGSFPYKTIVIDGLAYGTVTWLLFPFCLYICRKNVGYLLLGFGVILGLYLNLGFRSSFSVYAVYFVPIGALMVAYSWSTLPVGFRNLLNTYSAIVLVMCILAFGWNFRSLKRQHMGDIPEYMLAYEQTVNFLKNAIPPGSAVIATTIEIPLTGGYRIPHKLAMGMFGFTDSISQEDADRFHMTTTKDLIRFLEDPKTSAWVGSLDNYLNYSWSAPHYSPVADLNQKAIIDCLENNYDFAFSNAAYVVFLRKPIAH